MLFEDILDEIVALPALRVQKVFELFSSILVLELYSPIHKRLFFVFDQNQKTTTLHVQIEKPVGVKTRSTFILLLKKYLVGHTIRFYRVEKKEIILKALFDHDGSSFSIIFEIFPQALAGLFNETCLLASYKKDQAPKFLPGILETNKQPIFLDKNLRQAKKHMEKVRSIYFHNAFLEQLTKFNKALLKKQALLKNVESDLKKCQKNLQLEHEAELLRHNLHLIKRGMKEIEITDYSVEPIIRKKIDLEFMGSPQDYLEKIFQKIKKAKRGIAVILPRLETIRNDIKKEKEELQKFREKGPEIIDFTRVKEISPITIKKELKKRLPYRTYLSSDGIRILVGRSAKDSDELSLRHTKGNEWWFHARDIAGAHVVVKSSLDQLPSNTLEEAAMLAGYFSQNKSSSLMVQYTRAKYVRKPKHVPPGMVLIAKEKTIEIFLDEKILARLLKKPL
jgi:predicted ribosome quality control (RQC) complex YloA/Tae2 family protein